ncbi:helix-turn-helix domain-containing protein [Arthrobacter sp. NPDC093128]|uniref:helix-turn-helix domain-containing protein n=1 Tax=Arthrobacter sp. NPDC093128 TaxID=3154979 RepID=UPI00343B04D3
MTTNEAAAYLSGPVGFTLSAKLVRNLRYLNRGPVVEKRGSRLVYRKSALDAFLSENGTDPLVWIQGGWKKVADQLRGIAEATGDTGFDPMIETLDKRGPQDGWDPGQAEK